jgi:hypothetical protein
MTATTAANHRHRPLLPIGNLALATAALTISLLVLALAAPSAQARATVGTLFNQETEVFPVGTPDCLSGEFTGTETTTFTTRGRFVETESGFHVEGISSLDSLTVFTNGYHIDVKPGRSAHFAFNTSATSGETVFTQAAPPETHTIYNAENEAVARVMYIGIGHITYRDLNGNGQPDDGEITSSVDHLNVICI